MEGWGSSRQLIGETGEHIGGLLSNLEYVTAAAHQDYVEGSAARSGPGKKIIEDLEEWIPNLFPAGHQRQDPREGSLINNLDGG
jgi:hypothetical protein